MLESKQDKSKGGLYRKVYTFVVVIVSVRIDKSVEAIAPMILKFLIFLMYKFLNTLKHSDAYMFSPLSLFHNT